jgi:hypothetical protein
VLLVVAVALAGCGGSSKSGTGSTAASSTTAAGSTTSSNSSTSPSGTNYSLSQKVLNSLGLKQCSRQNAPSSVYFNPNASLAQRSFGGGAIFTAAPDCSKPPKTTILVATFSSHAGIAAGKKAIKAKYPKAGVASVKTIVIGVVGGKNPQATADKIVKELNTNTTSG